jgi:hypothetical protein
VFDSCLHVGVGHVELTNQIQGEEWFAGLTDSPDGQFRVGRRPELPSQGDVELSVQMVGDLCRYHHPAAWYTENERSFVTLESITECRCDIGSKTATGVDTVRISHISQRTSTLPDICAGFY